jgi:hypothetical protein
LITKAAILWRHRWYAIRPWVLDIGAALILLTAVVGWYQLMSFAAFYCRVRGWCA